MQPQTFTKHRLFFEKPSTAILYFFMQDLLIRLEGIYTGKGNI